MSKEDVTARAKEILKGKNLNCTAAQIAVLEVLFAAERPVSREDLLEKLGSQCPDKVTAYRILEKFCQVGLVHIAYLEDKARHYELAHHCGEKQCHPHFICNGCGQTFCLTDSSLPLIKGLKKGFVLQRQQVRIDGLCPVCS
ncbi:MAG: Fur family transcriptional regulator [Sedimentisphaerales bacterium]